MTSAHTLVYNGQRVSFEWQSRQERFEERGDLRAASLAKRDALRRRAGSSGRVARTASR